MSKGRSVADGWMLYVALAATTVSSVTLLVERSKLNVLLSSQNADFRELADRFHAADAARRGATEVLGHEDLPLPLVSGVGMDTSPSTALFYSVKASCEACGQNAKALVELSHQFPGHVIGVSKDSLEVTVKFTRRHGLAIPIVALATGSVVRLLPEEIAPVTIVVRDQRVVSMVYGKLYPSDVRGIAVALAGVR